MNRAALENCTHEERRIIEINYRRVLLKEITPRVFFEEMYRLLGRAKFAELFPIQAGNYTQNEPVYNEQQYPVDHYQNGNLYNERYNRPENSYYNAKNPHHQMPPTDQILSNSQEQNIQIPQDPQNNADMSVNIKSTDKFQDIIDYAGVNLKEEQEQIHNDSEIYDEEENDDKDGSIDELFDVDGIIMFVSALARKKKMNVDENVYNALYLSLRRKLAEIIEKMNDACKLRVDYMNILRSEEIKYEDKILQDEDFKDNHKDDHKNDPKDNQNMQHDSNIKDGQNMNQEKSHIENLNQDENIRDDDTLSAKRQNLSIDLKTENISKDSPKNENTSSINKDAPKNKYLSLSNISKIENDIKRQLWVLEEIEKNGLNKILQNNHKQKEEKKKPLLEREDLAVKKRLSNTVALAALGIQKKSWMSPLKEKKKKSCFLSLYSPYNEKEMEKNMTGRKIGLDDFVFVMEKDKRYNKSVFLIKEYFKK